METVTSLDELDEILTQPRVILYKHSTMCNLSTWAMGNIEEFATSHPETCIHVIDILFNRDISNEVESRLGIQHESPQLIVLSGGEVTWSGSHHDLTPEGLEEHLG